MKTNQILMTYGYKPVFVFASLAAFGRGLLELYRPAYWNPRTALDYAAVAGTSLMLLLLALGLWGFFRQHAVSSSRAAFIWRAGIVTSCISAAIVGISNFVEDAFSVKGLGYVWVVGILVLFEGLLTAGVSAFWVKGLPRWTGGLILACAASLLFMASGGLFGLGLALLALGMVDKIPAFSKTLLFLLIG
jgi:hypothetical protein